MSEDITTEKMTLQPVARIAVQPLTTAEVKQHIGLIQQITREVMKPATHYDKIPGTKKNTLLKPGADTLCVAFKFNDEPTVTEHYDGFDYSYSVRTRLFYIPTGDTVGYGVGECSTRESKYLWREAVCREEWEATPETRRRIHFEPSKDARGYKIRAANGEGYEYGKVLQVRQNPEDLKNTVLKMAKKRAKIDAVISATGCSDMFVQDLDDPDINGAVNPEGSENGKSGFQQPKQQPPKQQQSPSEDGNEGGMLISEKQRKMLYAKSKARGLTNQELGYIVWYEAGVNELADIPADKCNDIVRGIETCTPGNVIPSEG